jgi:esterase/lipase superfamily enzyme
MHREYHKWFSHRLNREMELLVFGHAGAPVLVFPTRQGRFYDFENWRQVEALRPRIEAGALQLFCIDSIDSESFYCPNCPPQARIARHNSYEDYITGEVVPFIRSVNPSRELVLHGCSLGAYHAVNLAARHPWLATRVAAFSGRFDLTRSFGTFPDLFHGYYDEDIYFHTPAHFVPSLSDPEQLASLRQIQFTFAVGSDDPFHASNADLSHKLGAQGVPNILHTWEGEAHRARDWRKMSELYL